MARESNLKRFTLFLAIIAVVFASLPTLLAWIATPPGQLYLGAQYGTDDHMVYAAWMKQASEGNLLMDNRFTTDSQPGLTVHLYFFVLGLVSKLVSIPVASNLARIGFSFLFVMLLGKFIRRLDLSIYVSKLAMILAVFGAGFGFLHWQPFGRVIPDASDPLATFLGGRLAIDVWQPEVFVFPSMLVNGLFMVSLCLIVGVFLCLLDARQSTMAALKGAGLMALLMNIHSYDALLVALVMATVAATLLVNKEASGKWLCRGALIGLGAVPPALYFLYVLSQDSVFQARAATDTFSATFRQLFVGLLPSILASVGLVTRSSTARAKIGFSLIGATVLLLVAFSGNADPETFFLSYPAWGLATLAAIAAVCLIKPPNHAQTIVYAWAFVGIVAPYLPQLFQRKLAMALIVPWAILGAIGLGNLMTRLERNTRNLVTALVVMVTCAGSIYWFQREILFVRNNVSSTTVQPVHAVSDVQVIIDLLDEISGDKAVGAMPGVPFPQEGGFPYGMPYIPDLNPVLSGLAGVYTYAGHWSETPEYDERRARLLRIFISDMPDDQKHQELKDMGIDYLVVPRADVYSEVPIKNVSAFTETLYEGRQFRLVNVVGR